MIWGCSSTKAVTRFKRLLSYSKQAGVKPYTPASCRLNTSKVDRTPSLMATEGTRMMIFVKALDYLHERLDILVVNRNSGRWRLFLL